MTHRERGQVDIVGDGQPRLERQLGNKMRRPDAGAEDDGRRGCQGEAPPPERFPCADKKVYRREASENTDERCKSDQPDIVLIFDAGIEDFKHWRIVTPDR